MLPLNWHLRKAEDFAYLRQHARRPLQEGGVRVYFAPSRLALAYSRLGMSISKKSGVAVQRNRLRRCWREIFRKAAVFNLGLDILAVLSPRTKIGPRGAATEQQLKEAWQHLLERMAQEAPCGSK
jgi:ribonuclease P protein component